MNRCKGQGVPWAIMATDDGGNWALDLKVHTEYYRDVLYELFNSLVEVGTWMRDVVSGVCGPVYVIGKFW